MAIDYTRHIIASERYCVDLACMTLKNAAYRAYCYILQPTVWRQNAEATSWPLDEHETALTVSIHPRLSGVYRTGPTTLSASLRIQLGIFPQTDVESSCLVRCKHQCGAMRLACASSMIRLLCSMHRRASQAKDCSLGSPPAL